VRRTATVALRKCSTCNSNRLACGSAESPRPGPIAGSDLRWRWPAQLVTTAGENGLSISARRLKLLCALHESGSGTKRTWAGGLMMSVIGGRPEVTGNGSNRRF
jgi:hypothetical protein